MKVNILLFGQLTDITGTGTITMENVRDTDTLLKLLQDSYPALTNSKYLIAVDKHIISENFIFADNCIVALLPPFSGG